MSKVNGQSTTVKPVRSSYRASRDELRGVMYAYSIRCRLNSGKLHSRP